MKSYSDYALDVVQIVFQDILTTFPNLRVSMERDLSYLRRAVEQRGLPFLTITLPALGKHLDRCLANGALILESIPKGVKTRRGRPLFLSGLINRVFNIDGTLKPDACITSVFYLRQVLYLFKKWRMECNPIYIEEAITDFFLVEKGLPHVLEDTWDSDVPNWQHPVTIHPIGWRCPDVPSDPDLFDPGLVSSRDSKYWSDFRDFCRRISSSLGFLDPWSIRPKHGPGVVAESHRGSKFDFPAWPKRLESYFPYDWHGSGILDSKDRPSDREPPSRLIAVPKTQKGPRLICAEPTAHQWIQQGIWRWLEDAIDKVPLGTSIDFRSQDESRKGAILASLTGELATIDLSSASDRLSARLVHFVLQGNDSLLDALHACRTRLCKQTISNRHDEIIRFKKFAPMGSAVTFPVQSVVFAIIAAFAVKRTRVSSDDPTYMDLFRQVRVFGDDIIVPTYAYQELSLLLQECGLKVNLDKSFAVGNFRESCGVDAFCGNDVTPAYFLELYDSSPSSLAATVECSNNFHKKGMWNTARFVADQLPVKERKLLHVSGQGDGTFGLFSFTGTDTSHLHQVWDKDYQYWKSKHILLSARAKKTRSEGYGDLSQYFFEKPDPSESWGAGTVTNTTLRKRVVGPSRK